MVSLRGVVIACAAAGSEAIGRTGCGGGAGASIVGDRSVLEAAPGVVPAAAGAPGLVRAAVADDPDAAVFGAVVAEVARAPDNDGADVHAAAPSSPARSAATPARMQRGNSNVWVMERTGGTAR
jgi:hypothetical protein